MENIVFQTDSEIVQKAYCDKMNYLIELDENPQTESNYCAIYFSSNAIYYPNTKEVFETSIINRNNFEWYNRRIAKCYKHIFIRDIFKQWYLAGINSKINNPEKLLDFLKKETEGFHIITLGSSAGGYAAILYGSLLNCDKCFAFNPQFEIKTLLQRSKESINPLVFRLRDSEWLKFYDINHFINNDHIFYFYSLKSQWDIEQSNHSNELKNLIRIRFQTTHHGIPFLKIALNRVINMEEKELLQFTKSVNSPFIFTLKMVGIRKTFVGFVNQLYQAYWANRH